MPHCPTHAYQVMDILAHVPILPAGLEPGGCVPVDGTAMAGLLGALPLGGVRCEGAQAWVGV